MSAHVAAGDQAALLAAIRDNPADDGVRLVYADWLEENGEADRAAFIRESIATGKHWIQPGGHDLRMVILDQPMRMTWGGGPSTTRTVLLAEHPTGSTYSYVVSRGFVSAVTYRLAEWLEHGPAVVSQHPIERVTATDKTALSFFDTSGWHTANFDNVDPSYLPPDVWAVLPPTDKTARRWRRDWKDYATEAEANVALSVALIAWARREAGV